MPDIDERHDRAARALGPGPAGPRSEATVPVRLVGLSRGPVATDRLVVGYEDDPLAPLFDATSAGP